MLAKQTLKVHTIEEYPLEYVEAQNTLGMIYNEISLFTNSAEKSHYVNASVEAYSMCLYAISKKNDPALWGGININLGAMYFYNADFVSGSEVITYYDKAIFHFEEGRSVFSREHEYWRRANDGIKIAKRRRAKLLR